MAVALTDTGPDKYGKCWIWGFWAAPGGRGTRHKDRVTAAQAKKSKISLSIWPPLASATRMRRHIACLLTLLPCGSPRPPLVTCDTATLTAARKNNMTRIVTCVVGGTFCSLSHLASLHDVFVVCGRCACRSELPQGPQAPDVRVGEEPSNSGDCLAEPHHCAASRYAL